MLEIQVKSFPVGFASDCHGHVDKLDEIRAAHPEITQWFFLGDLVCFQKPGNNRKAGEWLARNLNNWVFVMGNHCAVVSRGFINIEFEHACIIRDQFHKQVRLILPNGKNILLCHSKSTDFWEFVNVGYSEREALDDFSDYIDEDTQYIINGHGHKPLTHNFLGINAIIHSIGAAQFGEYGILTERGFEFKKLPE